MLRMLLNMFLLILGTIAKTVESLLFNLVTWYDVYIYTPLQTFLWPIVEQVPRCAEIRGRKYTIFSANIVSWARTFLVIPIAWCLKYNVCWLAFLLVLFHDFLDHLDGIVAKVQRQTYGPIDDPILGGFMDAFCDKIVNVLALWSIVMVTDFLLLSWQQTVLFVFPCVVIMAYEFVLGVVRVQDYFQAYYLRELKKSDEVTSASTAAIMEGKLKEKLESVAIAFLCLGQSGDNIMSSFSGIFGVVCLFLSIRLAHTSLTEKLSSRSKQEKPISTKTQPTEPHEDHAYGKEKTANQWSTTGSSKAMAVLKAETRNIEDDIIQIKDHKTSTGDTDSVTKRRESVDKFEMRTHHRRLSLPLTHLDGRVDRVYTVGCFDLFHEGHIKLLQRMKSLGKQVVVGVHDSRSIYNLKKRVPIDNTEQRMINVKKHADIVFCVSGMDPTNFIHCIFDRTEGETACYVRGNDMENFPARELCESLMTIKFLPYTDGVSTTKLRKHLSSTGKLESSSDDIYLFY